MSEKNVEKIELRKYLLGNIEVEIDQEKVEERLMTDDAYFQELLWQEEELVQDYVDNELDSDERQAFETHFLISDERLNKVNFAQALRKHIDLPNSPVKAEMELKKESRFRRAVKLLFSSPVPSVAAVGVAALLVTLTIFYFYPRSSSADLSLAWLNETYRLERPLESRITDLNYAPFYKFRGKKEEKIDENRRREAELRLLQEKSPNSEVLHTLGRLYLAEGDFDKAIDNIEKARQLSSKDAEIYNDLGVAYLEKYKSIKNDKDNNAELSIKALEYFDKAIELNPKLLDAYFNRAEAFQSSNLPNEAKQAWQKYLELDSTSKWADDARSKLESLKSQTAPDMKPDEMEKAFIRAFKEEKHDEAFRLASQNREMIRLYYLPQKLAMSFVDSEPAQRIEKLEALHYLGKLEKTRNDDNFASDLADFYGRLSESKIGLLKQAHAATKKGYELCLFKADFDAARKEFESARELFLRAGDLIEANTVIQYFIAYCYYDKQRSIADVLLKQVGDFSERNNYRWFALMNYYWLLGSQESLGYKTISETRIHYEESLQTAQNMGDLYMIQKFLLSLLIKSHLFKQEKKSLFYIQKLLELSTRPNLSNRQKFRAFDKIILVLSNSPYTGFSKAVVRESVSSAEYLFDDPSFALGAEINAGIIYTQTGNFEEAEEWFSKARQVAEQINRNADLVRIFLNLGFLERKRNNFRQSLDYYDTALTLSEKLDTPLLLYEIRKSRLLSLRELQNDAEMESEISSILELADEYRKQIHNEQERNTFFDGEQDVYDIAVEYEMQKNRQEQAYNYAEMSNSRSLLDWLETGTNLSPVYERTKNQLPASAVPLNINQIRESLPANVQLLQFRVLDDRILIFLISKENLLTFSSAIHVSELEEKVKNYLDLIQSKNPDYRDKIVSLSRELYQLLIAQVRPYLDPSRQICLIPNKILFYLPFASLISENEKYFLEDFTLLYSPSANVFIRCTENAKLKDKIKEEKLLSVGNPTFDREQFPDLENLPESVAETSEIAKNYSNPVTLQEKDATKSGFLSIYKNYEVIHFAGHYVVNLDSPLLSRLVMAKNGEDTKDGFLTNIELMSEKLPQTKLVVLSACETGVEGYYAGEGLIGLSRTFLVTGVPLVVASAWKVESEKTVEIMKNFHYYRHKQKFSSSQALRQAQLDMINKSNDKFQTISFWAAFAAFGGYTEF